MTTLSAFASSEIFFSSGEVVFAEMTGSALSLQTGDPVAVRRSIGGRSVVVARGSVFRVRDEHVTVTISSGEARAGDRIERWDGVTALEVTAEPEPSMMRSAYDAAGAGSNFSREAGPARSADADQAWPVIAMTEVDEGGSPARKILLYDIMGAPRLLQAEFNRSFAEALASDPAASAGATATNIGRRAVVMRAAGWRDRLTGWKMPKRSEIRSNARHRSADIVLLPVYVRSINAPQSGGAGLPGASDSVAVHVFDGKTGRQTGYSATKIRPFSRLEYSAEPKRIGRLQLTERYTNLSPSPTCVLFERDGSLAVEAMGDRFLLSAGEARFLGAGSSRPSGRHARIETGNDVVDIMVEPEGKGGRVVISIGGEPLFAAEYADPPSIATHGSRIAVQAGPVVEVLRITTE